MTLKYSFQWKWIKMTRYINTYIYIVPDFNVRLFFLQQVETIKTCDLQELFKLWKHKGWYLNNIWTLNKPSLFFQKSLFHPLRKNIRTLKSEQIKLHKKPDSPSNIGYS